MNDLILKREVNLIRSYYDRNYFANSNVFGVKPSTLIHKYCSMFANKEILDIGCGEGRNAHFLAKERGCLTVWEISQVALRKIQRRSQILGLEMKYVKKDMFNAYEDCKKYDAILISNVLHHYEFEKSKELLQNITNNMSVGAILYLNIFAPDGYLFDSNMGYYFPNYIEMLDILKNFSIVDFNHYVDKTIVENGKINSAYEILARKERT